MTRRIISLAALFVSVATIPAAAQDFVGCKPLQTADACNAAGWCKWRVSKPVALPNGEQIVRKSVCAFRPGFKAAFEQQAKK